MTEEPHGTLERAEKSGDEVISALQNASEVTFDIPKVGKFVAERLTGRKQMLIYKDRISVLRDEMGFTGSASECPRDALLAAEAIATLRTIKLLPVGELLVPGLWTGDPIDLPDDVLLEVYAEYYNAKRLVESDDEKAKRQAKNSSGGSAD